jgi:hypothetical protein
MAWPPFISQALRVYSNAIRKLRDFAVGANQTPARGLGGSRLLILKFSIHTSQYLCFRHSRSVSQLANRIHNHVAQPKDSVIATNSGEQMPITDVNLVRATY